MRPSHHPISPSTTTLARTGCPWLLDAVVAATPCRAPGFRRTMTGVPTSPPLAELTYQAWVLRRTPEGGLRVALSAFAEGYGDVLIPLPWSEVRLLDEAAPHALFWALFEFVVPFVAGQVLRTPHGVYSPLPVVKPPGRRTGPSPQAERVARLVARADLPADLARLIPKRWDFAKSFLWWPARPFAQGLGGRIARALSSKRRELLPLTLVVGSPASFFRAELRRIDMEVVATSAFQDVYVIDPEELALDPVVSSHLEVQSGLSFPGWSNPSDQIHCYRRRDDRADTRAIRFHVRSVLADDLWAEVEKHHGKIGP